MINIAVRLFDRFLGLYQKYRTTYIHKGFYRFHHNNILSLHVGFYLMK